MVSMKEIVAPRGEQPATSPTATEIAVAVSPPRLDAVRLAVVQFATGARP